jgi:C4-dicarboxylate transporter DctM subunit
VIVGVVAGIFTPTEAAGVAVAYAFLLALVYRAVTPRMLYGVFSSSVRISAQLMLTIAAASIFAWILARARVPEMVASMPVFHGDMGPIFLLLVINLSVFILGLVMEGTAILVIVTPIFLPVALAAGVDPVHLGVILAINLALGGIHPPFGVLMFVLCSVTPTTIVEFTKHIWPFLVLLIVLMMVITFVPQLSLALPDLLL